MLNGTFLQYFTLCAITDTFILVEGKKSKPLHLNILLFIYLEILHTRQNNSVTNNILKMYKAVAHRPAAIVDISTYRTIYGYERDHFWCHDILRLYFFIIKNNDYINFDIKMNITNILVDRATSVISSALCGGGGA